MLEKCKYCGTSFFKIVKKEETSIKNGIKQTHVWVGCISCWDILQKVS